jgi:hypothetical protein
MLFHRCCFAFLCVCRQALEAQPLAVAFHDAPRGVGWPHSGGLSAAQAAAANKLGGGGGGVAYAWGQRCWQFGLDHVLVAVPYNPGMAEALQQRLANTLGRLECGSRGAVKRYSQPSSLHSSPHLVNPRAAPLPGPKTLQ